MREFVIRPARALVSRKALWLGEVPVNVSLEFPERLPATPAVNELLVRRNRAPALRAALVFTTPCDQFFAIGGPCQTKRRGLAGTPRDILGHQGVELG